MVIRGFLGAGGSLGAGFLRFRGSLTGGIWSAILTLLANLILVTYRTAATYSPTAT